MNLFKIAARVAPTYKFHWAGRTDVLPLIDQVFHNAEIWPPRMIEVTGQPDTYEGEIDEDYSLRVEGTNSDDLKAYLFDTGSKTFTVIEKLHEQLTTPSNVTAFDNAKKVLYD